MTVKKKLMWPSNDRAKKVRTSEPVDRAKISEETWAILDTGDVVGFLEAVLGRPKDV